MTTSVSRISIILYIQFKIRTSSLPVICENWHSTFMWKTLLWTESFNLRRQCNLFYPPLFIEEPAPSQESGRSCIRACTKPRKWAIMYTCGSCIDFCLCFCDFASKFWTSCDGCILFVFHFIRKDSICCRNAMVQGDVFWLHRIFSWYFLYKDRYPYEWTD